jgi:hypothetical protein
MKLVFAYQPFKNATMFERGGEVRKSQPAVRLIIRHGVNGQSKAHGSAVAPDNLWTTLLAVGHKETHQVPY